jgi:hypothetical protein
MSAIVLRRAEAPRTLTARVWAALSALLMKLAEANIRNRSVEPFGL